MKPTILSAFLLFSALACSDPTDSGNQDPRLQPFTVDSIGEMALDLGRFHGLIPRWGPSVEYPFGYPIVESDSAIFVIMDARIGCLDKKGQALGHFAWASSNRSDSAMTLVGASSFYQGMECTLLGDREIRFRFPKTNEEIIAVVSRGEDGCAYLRMRLPRETTMQWGGVRYAGEDIPPTISFPQPTPEAVFKDEKCG